MLRLIVITVLTLFFYLRLKQVLDKRLVKANDKYENARQECGLLVQENIKLHTGSLGLEKNAEEIIALYDITKDICASLDEDKVFALFSEKITKYIKVTDCRFIKDRELLSQYQTYTVIPLEINKNPVGYLAAGGVTGQDKDKFYILAQQLLLGIKRALLYKKVQELSVTDSLTGVFSRRYCLERFAEEIARSRKFKFKFAFLMLDIDYFKGYNDRYGHLVGDAVLKDVAKAIKGTLRQIDLVGRYGGEEFSIILSETDKEQAKFAAERIRQAIASRHIKVYDENLTVTASIGISVFPDDAQDTQAIIDKADRALYQAKQAGRNKVCVS